MRYFFFDYIYYRIARWKYKSQGPLSATAIGFISLMQTMLIATIVEPVLKLSFTKQYLAVHSKELGLAAGILAILLMAVNYKVYEGKYERYQTIWGTESGGKRFYKGLLVIVSIFAPIFLFVVISNLVPGK